MKRGGGYLLALCMLAACSSPPAPVVDRSEPPTMQMQADGSYRVRRGDTLHAIAFRFGFDHRDIARWNGIEPPYTIYPDQVLRLSAPPRAAVRTQPVNPSQPPSRSRPVQPPATPPRQPVAPTPAPAQANTQQPSEAPLAWRWPVEGNVMRGFLPNDPARNGLDIGGQVGQSVLAAASGSVVYSGNGLIGYGELIIIKHNERLLSAYGHNRRRLVEEGETVSAGQKIAEMGHNDRNEALLHFEIRNDGRPVDPRQFLPRR